MNQANDFTAYYSSLGDDDLLRLTAGSQSLLPAAREALRSELRRRDLQVDGFDWGPQPVAPSRRAAMTMARYREGYLHARAIDGFGGAVKTIALLVGGLLVASGIIACIGSSNSFGGIGQIGGIVIFLAGLLLGGLGYILGVLVQSAGQSMKAHFDSAVNGSHFLNDDQRAEVMSIE